MLRRLAVNGWKIKVSLSAIVLIKVQTYNCIDTINNSILFTRQKDKKQMNPELILHNKIIHSLKKASQ